MKYWMNSAFSGFVIALNLVTKSTLKYSSVGFYCREDVVYKKEREKRLVCASDLSPSICKASPPNTDES